MALGRAAGLEPGECNPALALDSLLYDKQSQDTETPRKVSLAAIGQLLTSKKQTDEDSDAGWQKAQREISNLFVHAYPRVGLAMQMRHKALNPKDGHMYSSPWGTVAGIVAEEFNAERGRILASTEIKREDKGRAIGEALERLAADALGLFDKPDTLIIENNKPWAVVTEAQAKAFHKLNPQLFEGPKAKFRTSDYAYTPKPEPDPEAPYTLSDLEDLRARMVASAERQFWAALERSDLNVGSRFIQDVKKDFDAMCLRVVKVAGASERHTEIRTYKEKEELSLVHEKQHDGTVAAGAAVGASAGQHTGAVILKNEYETGDNPNKAGYLKIDDSQFFEFQASAEARARGYVGPGAFLRDDDQEPDPAAAFPAPADELLEMLEVDNSGADPEPEPVKLEGSVNFDSTVDAALFYVGLGFAVLPSCQFNPATGRCTGPATHHKNGEVCKGKKPLLAGPKGKDGKPVRGEGYTGACRDRGVIRQWFTKDFPNAGVTIRLDNAKLGCDCVLIEGDVKDGKRGAHSYAVLRDTFDLPETLTGVSHSGGPHYVFALPEGFDASRLGSWTNVLANEGLDDVDIKVGRRGLEHVEPTIGTKGVYRWVDPYAEIATLPVEVCEYLIEVHSRDMRTAEEKAADERRASSPKASGPFDPAEDQAKYLKDAPRGGRRPRLRTVACALAARGATVEQIVDKLKVHDSGFKEAGPTNDYDFMLRVAQSAVQKFGQGVAR
jgi:hypothetical protein